MAWFQSKQQKLAVEMWEYIKKKLQDGRLVRDLKSDFAEQHGLEFQVDNKWQQKWVHNCWLCANAKEDCSKCALRSCKNYDTPFAIAGNVFAPLQERFNACEAIIKAIKDTDHYYVLEGYRLTTVPRGRIFVFEGTLKECLEFIGTDEGEEDEI